MYRSISILLALLPLGLPAQELCGQVRAEQGLVEPAGPFQPDTIFPAQSGATVMLLPGASDGVAALRLSVPLDEHPAEAGAGLVLGTLALERMQGAARQVGAYAAVDRTPWGLAFTVSGAEVDLEYLTYLLRIAVEEPGAEPHVVSRIRRDLTAARLAEAEAPFPRLLSALRAEAAPAEPRRAGTPITLPELSLARLREVWSRTHRADRMSVVASTSFDPAVLLANLDRLGATGDTAPSLGDAPAPPEHRAEAPPSLRPWHAQAWVDQNAFDAHAPVLAALVTSRVESGPSEMEMTALLEQLSDRSMLVIAGAAFPRRANAVRERVTNLLPSLAASLTEEEVRVARNRVELEFRTAASTPAGRVEAVGRGFDATGDPDFTRRYLEALGAVTEQSLIDYISSLSGPVSARVAR